VSTTATVRPRFHRRGALLPTLVVAAAVIVGYLIFTNIWTDRLWYQSIGFAQVFSTLLWTRLALFVVFGVLLAAAVVASSAIAYRLRPRIRHASTGSALIDRYREVLESRFVWLLIALGVVVGLFAGGAASSQAQTYLAWRNGTPFGIVDPKFGLDVGFFVFDYPWWRFVASFAFTLFLFAAAAAAVVHYVSGGLRLGQRGRGSTPAAQAHLSVLLGLAVVVKGVQYWFDQYGLSLSNSTGLFYGMTYTSANITTNAKMILAIIAGICALIFFANALLRRWAYPIVGLVLMVLSGLLLGVAYPAAYQALSVKPDEPDKERPYIQDHISATRAAYGVDNVEITDYAATTTATAGQLRSDAEALPGIRLIDPAVVPPAFEQLQQVRGYYSFSNVLDVDRYTIDNVQTDAVVAVREIDVAGLDQRNWNNVHTVFTHGYGLVAAYGNRAANGEPEWIAQDIPPTGALSEHEPRIYFGERQTDFALVGAKPGGVSLELDTPGGGEGGAPQTYTYEGKGGVPVGSPINRLLYATKFVDANLLLSDRIDENTKIMYDRTPGQRVQNAAPWLTIDQDAYPAVVEGRVVWIVDAYTTSNFYPNSQRVSLRTATADSQSSGLPAGLEAPSDLNYMRNSVKAVVDAFDGSVKLYGWDEADPILQTWKKVFPGLVLDKTAIPADLLSHLRYPEDMFKVQRQILERYHVTDPGQWYAQNDLWQIPQSPVGNTGSKETPYFLSIKWPGDDEPVFSQTTVYTPNGRQNLAAYMAVNADASSPNYGHLRILRMSDSSQIDGPGQTANAMATNPIVAEALRPFLNQGSAGAINGNLLTLPVGGGLLYVQPIYTQRAGSDGSYPALQFVVARFGQTIGIGTSLQQALDQVFAGDSGANTGENGGNTGNTPEQPAGEVDNPAALKAMQEANAAFGAADKALKSGDLAEYQKKIGEAQAAVARALKAMGQG